MPDRHDRERELESELRDLGSHVEHPPTPDLAREVGTRISEEPQERTARRRIGRPLPPALRGVAAAAVFVLAVSAPALSPEVRGTVSGWFEAGGSGAAGGASESGGADSPKQGVTGGDSASESEAGCVSPVIRAEPRRAEPGERFTLHGDGFFIGCNDTGRYERESPDREIRIELRQGEKTWRLAAVEAREDYSFEERLKVPADASPGRAVVSAAGHNRTAKKQLMVLED